jgi:UDP-GlcNAc:undecaprenyl-phosphate GlcNAc-1-phosphate transferase
MPSLSASLIVGAAIAAAVAAVITSALVPLVIRVAAGLQALDHPGGRREQDEAVPRLGGLAVVTGLSVSLLFMAVLMRTLGQLALPRNALLAMALATFMVFLVGLVDDIAGVSVLDKFVVQLLAAFLIIRIGWSFDVLGLPGGENLALGVFGQAVSVIWIVGVTNAINLIDGLDGLAGGVVAIIAASFLVYAVLQGNELTAVALAAVMGACLGFLRYNWHPARIYLGDCGSLTLGFLLAITSVHSSLKAPAAIAILVPILALGVPVMDTLLVMVVRFLERPKGPLGTRLLAMFRADRNHLHHLLLRFSGSRATVVGWIYASVLAFCLLALAVAITRSPAIGAVLIGTEFVAIVVMRRLGLRGETRTLSEQKRALVRDEVIKDAVG